MSSPVVITDASQPPTVTRRCWRCLQQFPCDATEVHAGPAEWWLCDVCHQALIGPARPT